MELNYFLPSPRLQSLVTVLGNVASRGSPSAGIVPAMLPNLHIRLAGRSVYRFEDGTAEESPAVALLGPSSGAFDLSMSADFEMVFAGLLPFGWRALIPLSADTLTGRIVDAGTIWPASAVDRLLARLHAAQRPLERNAIVEAFLAERTPEAWPDPCPHLSIIDRWIETSPDLSIDSLCAELDVGHRQMRRLTLQHHGAAPKSLAMKYRALRAALSLSIHGAAALNEAGVLYADQSHLIRDFRRFVGWTPHAFVAQEQNLAAATLFGRYRAGAVRPLSLFG